MKFLKEKYKYVIVIVICILCSLVATYATTYLAQSDEVDYNNTSTGIVSGDVQGAIDELYSCATSSSSYASRLANLEGTYKNVIHPVGSIYISVSSTNPSTLFGGTWVAFATGRSLIGINTSDTSFDVVEETGGTITRTLAEGNIPSHNHSYKEPAATSGAKALTEANLPAHTHTITGITVGADGSGSSTFCLQNDSNVVSYKAGSTAQWSTGTSYTSTASGYYRLNMGAGTTPLTSTGGGGSHSHSITKTSADTVAAGSSTAVSVKDPYIVVYMWKRTA